MYSRIHQTRCLDFTSIILIISIIIFSWSSLTVRAESSDLGEDCDTNEPEIHVEYDELVIYEDVCDESSDDLSADASGSTLPRVDLTPPAGNDLPYAYLVDANNNAIYEENVVIGSTYTIRADIYSYFESEYYTIEVRQGSPTGTLIGSINKSHSKASSSGVDNWTWNVTWNTSNRTPGYYYVTIKPEYESNGTWYTGLLMNSLKLYLTYTPVTPSPVITPNPDPAKINMQRLYNPNSGEHFYTGNITETYNLIGYGWRYEGIGWVAPVSGAPVYRMYNRYAGDHHYTMNVSERDYLVSVGWTYEGVGWYSASSSNIPLYRLYNPYCTGAGSHHYTLNMSEVNYLRSIGWRYEGISWYGL